MSRRTPGNGRNKTYLEEFRENQEKNTPARQTGRKTAKNQEKNAPARQTGRKTAKNQEKIAPARQTGRKTTKNHEKPMLPGGPPEHLQHPRYAFSPEEHDGKAPRA